MRGSSRASASTALRPCSGSEPACAERPRATTSSQRPPLRAATTAPPGRPHSMHRTASKPASRACVAIGSERTSSSGTLTSSSRAKGRSPAASSARCVCRHGQPALHVRDAGPDQAVALAPQRSPRGGAEREDGVVMAEQRDARPPGALERRRARAGRPARARARTRARSPRASAASSAASASSSARAPLGESWATQRARSPSTSSRSAATASRTCRRWRSRRQRSEARAPGCASAASRSRTRAR